MTTADSLLAYILTHPGEYEVRLAYADVLEESSESARGEIIRVQCELERRWPGNPAWPIHGRREALHRRERELLGENVSTDGRTVRPRYYQWCEEAGIDPAWVQVPGFTVGADSTQNSFRGGFVEQVAMSCAVFVGGRCGRCQGDGVSHHLFGVPIRCTDCRGAGKTEGAAGALFKAAPVREVRLDRKAYRGTAWVREGGRNDGRFGNAVLPSDLFDCLPDRVRGNVGSHANWYEYNTEQTAHDALAAACLTLGRRRAWPCDYCAGTGEVRLTERVRQKCGECLGLGHTVVTFDRTGSRRD